MKKTIYSLAFVLLCHTSLMAQTTQELSTQGKALYDKGQYTEALVPIQKLASQGDASAQCMMKSFDV